MKFKINYCIRRKSDNKLMGIRHIELDEQVVLDAAKENLTAPIHLSVGDDETDEYKFDDIEIVEVVGLR